MTDSADATRVQAKTFVSLLVAEPTLDTHGDGRVDVSAFCAAVRRQQLKWSSAKVSPARTIWRP